MLAATLAWNLVFAPAPPASPDEYFVTEVAFGTSMGILVMNPGDVGRAYAAEDYPSFVPTQWTPFAVDGELWIGRHGPAFDFIRFAQARADDPRNGVRSQLRSTLTELSYGYAVVDRKGFGFAPRLGLGLFTVEHRAQSDGEVDVDAVLGDIDTGDAAPTLSVEKTSAVVDLGLSVSYMWEFGKRKDPNRIGMGTGLRVGLRVGGLVQLFDFGPQRRAWTSSGQATTQAPDMRVDGFYLRLFVAPSLLHRSRVTRP